MGGGGAYDGQLSVTSVEGEVAIPNTSSRKTKVNCQNSYHHPADTQSTSESILSQ